MSAFRNAVKAAARAAGRAARPVGSATACTVQVRQLASAATSTSQPRAAAPMWALLSAAAAAAGTTSVALAQPAREQSFIMIKPDGVHRSLIGDIIKRFEQRGYKLVGIKVLVPSKELASRHYAEHDGKPFFPGLVGFLSSGAVIAMVWEGDGIVSQGRAMLGATKPQQSAPGTIRGDYGIMMGRNIIHASDSVESAQKEIALWFDPADIAQYKLNNEAWVYED